MRKVLSFVLVLSLVLGSFSMAFAATPATGFSDMNGEASAEAVAVLSDLGVVSGYPDGEYKPENVVTRAEMAVLIVRALGLENYVSGTAKSSFTDMAGYGWAEGYIAYAESLGILSGYGDGTVKPGNTVTYDEATSMLVRALGYTTESLTGTYPANFVVRAKALGILDGIEAGPAGANRGDIAIMLYQTLDQKIGSVNKDGEWVDNNRTDKEYNDDTMLARLGAKQQPAKVIDNGDAEDAKINIRKYVGAYAVTYTKDDKIIAVGEVKSTFLTGDFKTGDIFKAGGVDYTNATTAALSTTPDALYFENGVNTVDAHGPTHLNGNGVTLAVKLSGKKIVDIYSVAKWTNPDTFLFEDDMLDEESLNNIDFTLNDDDEIDLTSFELRGVSSLKDIDEDNVVYVYTSNGEITRVEVGTEVVKGKITRTDADKYYIDGKGYKYDSNGTGAPAIGETGTALLNFKGDIYDWDADDASSGNYAMVTGDYGLHGGRDNTVVLFDKNGSEKEYVVKSGLTITSTAGITEGDLVEFSLDKDGKVNKLNERNLTDVTDGGKLSKSGNIIDGQAIATGVVVFVENSIGDYDLGKIEDIEKDKNLFGEASYYAPNGKVEAIVVSADVAKESDSVYGVLNLIDLAVNDDDEDVNYLTGFVDGKAFTGYTDYEEWVSAQKVSAENGLIEFKINADGVVTEVATGGDITSEAAITDATIMKRDGNLIQVTGSAVIADGTWIALDSSVVVYEYDGSADSGKQYSVRSVSALRVDQNAKFYQVDKDSEKYDVVIFVKQ
jgi:hypothetical protein